MNAPFSRTIKKALSVILAFNEIPWLLALMGRLVDSMLSQNRQKF